MKAPLRVPPQSQTHFRTLDSRRPSNSWQPLGMRSRNADPGNYGKPGMGLEVVTEDQDLGLQGSNSAGGVKPQVGGSQGQFSRVRKLKAGPWV